MAEFKYEINGTPVTIDAPDRAAADGVAQTIQQQMQAGGQAPAQAAYQGDAPQVAPLPSAASPAGVAGQDILQRGANMSTGLREIGRGLYGGAVDMATFGLDDEISGLARGVLGPGTVREGIDASRAWKDAQNPTAFGVGGILGGAAMIPLGGVLPTVNAFRGASTAARAGNAALTGAAGGLAYGAGGADGGNMLANGGVGAAIGGVLGPIGPVIGSAARGVGNLLRREPARVLDQRAAGAVEGVLSRDAVAGARASGGVLPTTGQPGEFLRRGADTVERERALGMPIVLADTGGTNTRRLVRSASNQSPNPVLDAELSGRFANQTTRMQDQISDITNMPARGDTGGTLARLEAQARVENRTRYDAAYNSPAAQAVWTPRLQELTRSPVIQDAMRGVNRTAANDAALLGTPAVRNPFTIDPATGSFRLGNAVPSLQYWDIVQRNLNDAIDGAVGGERRQLQQLRSALVDELDAVVPEFRAARAGAAAAFGARDALEAGSIMATDFRLSNGDFNRAFTQLSPAEQDLFREGYLNQIQARLSQTGDNRNAALLPVFNTPEGRARSAAVLGRAQADEMENLVRLENAMNLLKTAAQGNSTTAQQLMDVFRSPAATAAGAGTAISLATGGVRPGTLAVMGLVWGARKGQGALNEATARRVGELLGSSDPAAIRQAASILASTPVGNMALRNMEAALSRVFIGEGTNTATGFAEQAGLPGFQ